MFCWRVRVGSRMPIVVAPSEAIAVAKAAMLADGSIGEPVRLHRTHLHDGRYAKDVWSHISRETLFELEA